MMTTPASILREELRKLVQIQIDTFRRDEHLTPEEIEECRARAEDIRHLSRELDQISNRVVMEQHFGRAS